MFETDFENKIKELINKVTEGLTGKTNTLPIGKVLVLVTSGLAVALLLAFIIKYWYISLCVGYFAYNYYGDRKLMAQNQVYQHQFFIQETCNNVWEKLVSKLLESYKVELGISDFNISNFQISVKNINDYPEFKYYVRIKNSSSFPNEDKRMELSCKMAADFEILLEKYYMEEFGTPMEMYKGAPVVSLHSIEVAGDVVCLRVLHVTDEFTLSKYLRRQRFLAEEGYHRFVNHTNAPVEEDISHASK